MGYFEDIGERGVVDEFDAFVEAICFEGIGNV
jgi:hypothetical protein